jgi:isoquinoline 1-oxidoreductase subunit beta
VDRAGDCGTVVNPDIVRAQIASGVVYGISAALWGEITIEAAGSSSRTFTTIARCG